MSKQEIINMEFNQLRTARNKRSLKGEFNRMTNDELYAYVCAKWNERIAGDEK